MSEPAPRTVDVRVGSSTDALTPVSVAERSLAAGPQQWLALGAVVTAAIAADQVTKLIVSSHPRHRPATGFPLSVAPTTTSMGPQSGQTRPTHCFARRFSTRVRSASVVNVRAQHSM